MCYDNDTKAFEFEFEYTWHGRSQEEGNRSGRQTLSQWLLDDFNAHHIYHNDRE